MSSKGCPQVDRNGSHAFVQWQHQQQQLYKKMYPSECQNNKYISRYSSKGCPQVDDHGSHLFVQWQRQQQRLNPVINRTGSIGFVLRQQELQSLNRTTIDRVGSLGFVQWQRKQQQLYKQRMKGVAGKNEQQRSAPRQNNGCMEQGHPQVDRHGSDKFIKWQNEQQLRYKQMKLKNPPKVDQHGSQEFVEWQQKQQELYKEMNGVVEKVSKKAKVIAEPTWKVDQHGSHGFVEMQKQQQQKYKQMKLKNPPKVDRNGSHDFVEWQQKQQELYKEMNPQVDRHGSHQFIEWQHEQQLRYKQMKLKNPPKIDQKGSHDFVEWQQKQQQLYKEMHGVAEKVSVDAFCIVQSLSRYYWLKSEDKVHGLMLVIHVILKGS